MATAEVSTQKPIFYGSGKKMTIEFVNGINIEETAIDWHIEGGARRCPCGEKKPCIYVDCLMK